ncbi:MAG: DEAD/DEAH box helicase [Oculatellaceae cyanobacterium Prado106]|jgi:ATP-dependent Lhr-like helicase|nr:DEAD/DEAH box helicase [Oculatellaceae cyanobacterium Prado106]
MTISPPSDSSPPSVGFNQLHPLVKRWIWDQRWSELRDIQEQAIAPILSGTTDLIITAATAGGKTEAAFLPIFSKLKSQEQPKPESEWESEWEQARSPHPTSGVQTLYLSPLKALINDQYQRLSDLGERLEIPVHPWHGDVDSSRKQRVLQTPAGILLITPESLEAMFVRRGHELTQIFSGLQYVVIDELHSFIGSERGQQLRSLLHRLELILDRRIPRIGLSATLGEMDLAKDYLRMGEGDRVHLIQSSETGQEIKLQVRGYRKITPIFWGDDAEPEQQEEHSNDEIDIAKHLFKVLRGGKNLIFINRRQEVERYADLLNRFCQDHHVPSEFMPHHGSLAKDLREDAEAALKDNSRPANVICTSTLELGIDIGSVNSIAQVGTPYSVASIRQRLGRSGRRPGDPAILRVYITEPDITPFTPAEKTLFPSLMQAIATLNLLLQGWYEPPLVSRLHLSTLVQQLLSLIAQQGGISPQQSYQILCNGVFTAISPKLYQDFLRCLGQQDLIVQSQEGLLLLGLKGERLVNHYSFYTAFKTPEEFRLTHAGKTLGTLPIDYPLIEGMYLIFGGKRWQILSIDRDHRVIDVTQSTAGRVPYFGGEPGLVHDRIRQEMQHLYTLEDPPIFLDATAIDLFQEAQRNFQSLQLDQRSLIPQGSDTVLFPWAGSLVLNTLMVLLLSHELEVELGAIALTIRNTTPKELRHHIKRWLKSSPPDAIDLATAVRNKITEKHDPFLDDSLLARSYATSHLDVVATWEALRVVGE